MAGDAERVRRLARLAGLSSAELRRYVELEVVRVELGEVRQALIPRLRRIRRLRHDLSLSEDAVVIIVRLLDRIEALEGNSQAGFQVRIS